MIVIKWHKTTRIFKEFIEICMLQNSLFKTSQIQQKLFLGSNEARLYNTTIWPQITFDVVLGSLHKSRKHLGVGRWSKNAWFCSLVSLTKSTKIVYVTVGRRSKNSPKHVKVRNLWKPRDNRLETLGPNLIAKLSLA